MKRYLLDTCAISDARGPRANAGLVRWLAESDADTLYISVITMGEICWGIELLPAGRKRNAFDRWLREEIRPAFEGRILAIDERLMPTWGRVRAAAKRYGNNANGIDLLLAATALGHDLILVTRNEKDFAGTAVPIINPWS
jgi:toxin FitB